MTSDAWPEDIPIWIDGTQKWMTGLTRRTTCDDVIYALLYARGLLETDSTDNYAVFERWRAVERPLQGRTKIVKVCTTNLPRNNHSYSVGSICLNVTDSPIYTTLMVDWVFETCFLLSFAERTRNHHHHHHHHLNHYPHHYHKSRRHHHQSINLVSNQSISQFYFTSVHSTVMLDQNISQISSSSSSSAPR